MTKQEQINVNEIVVPMYKHICEHGYRGSDYCNLRSCQARTFIVCHKETGEVLGTALISYATMVAFIDEDGVCYDFLRHVWGYSATSVQHIAKFKHDYDEIETYTYRPV